MSDGNSNLHALMREVAATQRAELERQALLPEVRRRVQASTAGVTKIPGARETRGARTGGFRLVAFGTCAAAAIAIVGVTLSRDRELSFALDDSSGPGRPGELLRAAPGRTVSALFSDGSRVVVGSLGQARVDGLDADGATVTLIEGGVDVSVVHRKRTRWQVRAGAYTVRVTGTHFSVGWSRGDGALTVRLYEGAVLVSGPGVTDAEARVAAGQELRVTSGHATLAWADVAHPPSGPAAGTTATAGVQPSVVPLSSPGARVATVTPPPDERPAQPRSDETAPAHVRASRRAAAAPAAAVATSTPAPADEADGDWRALAGRARYHEALRSVLSTTSFDVQCARLPAEDLVLLGDVARLDGDVARATRAYQAALRRFPATDRPAFALGVIAFETRHDYRDAASWFDRYLREHRRGALATEAAGRLIESLQRSGDTARAREAARSYLRDHPTGPHAALARRLAGS